MIVLYAFPREEDLEWARNNDPEPSEKYPVYYASDVWNFHCAQYDLVKNKLYTLIAKDNEHGRYLYSRRFFGELEKYLVVKRYVDADIGEEGI